MLPARAGSGSPVGGLEFKRPGVRPNRQLAAADVFGHPAGKIVGFTDVHDPPTRIAYAVFTRLGRRPRACLGGGVVFRRTPRSVETHFYTAPFIVVQYSFLASMQNASKSFEAHRLTPLLL